MAIVKNMASLEKFELSIDGECSIQPKDTLRSSFTEAGKKIITDRTKPKPKKE